MVTLRKILADIDVLSPHHPALQRAAELASITGARLKVVDVLPDVPNAARRFVTEAVEQELVDDRLQRVRAAVERLGVTDGVETGVLRGRPADALAAEAGAGAFDLIVRRRGPDQGDALPELGSVDRKLARQAPCSVWLLAPGPSHAPRRILAAVDVGRDAAVRALPPAILEMAQTIAALDHADVTLFNAYHLNGEEFLAPYIPAQGIHDLRLEAEREATKALEDLIANAVPSARPPHVATAFGEAEAAIPEFARTHAMDLVVLGSESRSALARFVLGSTAERMLHDLEGSLLLVKAPDRERRTP